MVLCLGEPPVGFCDIGCCCCFSSLEVFMFPHYFSLPLAHHLGFSGLWRPPPALSSTLPTFSCFTFSQAFPSHFYCKCHGFEWAFFTHRQFFTLHSFPIFLTCFVTQMQAGTPHLESSPVPALTELLLLADTWTWTTYILVTRPWIYQLCQWAMRYRVKIKLLNMFHLFKVIWKDYKNALNKTW